MLPGRVPTPRTLQRLPDGNKRQLLFRCEVCNYQLELIKVLAHGVADPQTVSGRKVCEVGAMTKKGFSGRSLLRVLGLARRGDYKRGCPAHHRVKESGECHFPGMQFRAF